MKKLLSFVLVVAIMLCALPLGAFTLEVSAAKNSYYTYEVENNKATITKVDTWISGDVVIPSDLDGYSVVAIGDSAFYNCKRITKIIIPNSVTSIGNSAFSWCEKIQSVTIPSSVTRLGDYAFSYCKALGDVTVPESVANIGNSVFCGCASLKNINLPKNVTSIGDGFFDGCTSLTTITIPSGVTSIGNSAFAGCKSLESFKIPSRVTIIGSCAFEDCTSLANITIPDSVMRIGENAFANTAYFLDEANWEEDVLYINNHLIKAKESFSDDCVVKSGTKTIADRAFSWCEYLSSVSLPSSIVSIGSFAFYWCDLLNKITIPDSVVYIGDDAFNNCSSLENVKIPKGTKTIGNRAFFFCSSLTSVTIPNGTTSIGSEAFKGCTNLEKITIPSSVTSIGSSAFNFCNSLKSIIIPKNVSSIGNNAIDNRYTTTIYGYINSNAQSYAKTNKIQFVRIWDVSTKTTAVYNIKPSSTISGFDSNNIIVFDKNGNEIAYNDSKNGWPLTKGVTYKIAYKSADIITGSITWSLTSQASKIFADTSSSAWYHDAVNYVASVGLLTGYENGNFGTSDSIKRQDFLVILARLDGANLAKYDYNSKLTDVKSNGYYKTAVNWAIEKGITTGYSNGKFGVNDKMTREQLVTFLYRYAQYKGVATSVSANDIESVKAKYKDFKKVSEFSQEAIVWAIKNNIISGKDSKTIAPQGDAQRCEVAKIMYNIFLNDVF